MPYNKGWLRDARAVRLWGVSMKTWAAFVRLYEDLGVFRASLGASWGDFVRLYEDLGRLYCQGIS